MRTFTKSVYLFEKEFNNLQYEANALNYSEFEVCKFINCDFSKCAFKTVTFIDCIFEDCNFTNCEVNYAAFRTVSFHRCKIEAVNFSMCDKLIFDIAFINCSLDFSKFYGLKIKGINFKNSRLLAVDFMAADLTGVVFDNCDLYRAEFDHAVANKCNFKSSINYTIDPSKTRLKKAIFSLEGVKGLLTKHDIVIN